VSPRAKALRLSILVFACASLVLSICYPGQVSTNETNVGVRRENSLRPEDLARLGRFYDTEDRIVFADRFFPLNPTHTSSLIYSLRPDGTDLIFLGEHPGRIDWLAWSPDRTRIVFAAQAHNAYYDVWVMKSDGSAQTRVTSSALGPTSILGLSWSLDGSTVYFGARDDIYSVGLTDRVTKWAYCNVDSLACEAVMRARSSMWVSRSPDEKQVTYVKGEPGAIYVANADGSDVRLILDGLQVEDSIGLSRPSWSPH